MAKLIKPDGTTTEITPKNGKNFKLDELYAAIGCETVQICQARSRGEILIFDEEFLYRGDLAKHPHFGIVAVNADGSFTRWQNDTATDMMHTSMEPHVSNIICGNAILCKNAQFK